MSKKKVWVPAAAGITALALVGGMGVATAVQKNDVELTIDGETTSIAVRERTVGDVLELEDVTLGEYDVVLPSEDTKVTDGMAITVSFGRPLELSVDGEERTVWTTALTVEEALEQLRLDDEDSKLSASRSAGIGRDGLELEIHTAKDVTLTAGGTDTVVRMAGTVEDVLDAHDIVPDEDDIVEPAVDTLLADGMTVRYVDVEIKDVGKDVAIPFEKTTKESKEMDKGTSKVTQAGVDGVKHEIHTEVYHDGELQNSELKSSEVTKEPVTQVTTVGTRVPPPVVKKESSTSSSSSSSSRSGTKYDWMRAAGIPESQWTYVDYIVSRESSWNPNARNRSSGACGLAQALPCSKVGANWNDPVTSLKWQYNYVKSRYGGYQGAYNFWQRNHWY